jgi:hypothetical protein
MDPNKDYQQVLASIRELMERSVKFISLSGLSGILAGTYALIGAVAAYFLILSPLSMTPYPESGPDSGVVFKLMAIALVVLVASLITGFSMSSRKANQQGSSIWNETSKRLIINLLIPLASGGVFILILLFYYQYYGLVAPACLIFYGLALINASPNLYEEIRYLGYCEIILGLISAAFPAYGLIFWTIGFGILHIFYGTLMYRKYDR